MGGVENILKCGHGYIVDLCCKLRKGRRKKRAEKYRGNRVVEMMQTKRTYMSVRLFLSVAVAAGALGMLNSPALADDVVSADALSDAEFKSLLTQLDHKQFAEREKASKRLASGNAAVVKSLAAAIEDGKHEVNYRILSILSAMRLGENDEVAKAARGELIKLCKSDREAIAAQARATFYPRGRAGEEAMFTHANIFGGMRKIEMGGKGGGIAIAGDTVKIFGRSQVVRSRVQDGEQLVVVHQGIGRMIVLRVGEGGIEVHVSEQKEEGLVEETEYHAIDVDELKKDAPAAYKIYNDFKDYKGGAVLNGMPAD